MLPLTSVPPERREVRSMSDNPFAPPTRILTSASEAPATKAEHLMYASIHNITFDCTDARAQALFWAAVTGWRAAERDATPGHVEYAVVPPGDRTPRLYFTTVPEPRTAKNRVHLDLMPPGDDPKAELARPPGTRRHRRRQSAR